MASREMCLEGGSMAELEALTCNKGREVSLVRSQDPSRDSVPGRTRGRATTSTESQHLSGYKAVRHKSRVSCEWGIKVSHYYCVIVNFFFHTC